MTDDIPSLAEAMAEIRRQRARIAELDVIIAESTAEARRLTAEYAVTFGTLAQPTQDEPATITHNLPPTAPPHDE